MNKVKWVENINESTTIAISNCRNYKLQKLEVLNTVIVLISIQITKEKEFKILILFGRF